MRCVQRNLPCKVFLMFLWQLWPISTAFIVLNVPFFVAWCANYIKFQQRAPIVGESQLFQLQVNPTEPDRTLGWVSITRTIFFGNYCVNFFIYSLSGAYFRRYLRSCVTCGRAGNGQDDTTNGRMMDTGLRRKAPSSVSGHNQQMIAMRVTSGRADSTQIWNTAMSATVEVASRPLWLCDIVKFIASIRIICFIWC